MIKAALKALTGTFSTFGKSILVTLLLALLSFVMVEYVLPLRECRKTEIIMTTLVDENNLLKITCDAEKFEDKWANIAKEHNNKEKDTNEEFNISTDGNGSTIIF